MMQGDTQQYEYQLKYLAENGIANISIVTNDGIKSLAEILMDYGVEYYTDTDPGEDGRQDY